MLRFNNIILSLALITATAVTVTAAPDRPVRRIEVFPAALELVSRHHPVQLVVTGYLANGQQRDLTGVMELVPADTGVVRVERGRLLPVANGKTRVVAKAAGRERKVTVQVQLLPGVETAGERPDAAKARRPLTREGGNEQSLGRRGNRSLDVCGSAGAVVHEQSLPGRRRPAQDSISQIGRAHV